MMVDNEIDTNEIVPEKVQGLNMVYLKRSAVCRKRSEV